METYSINSIKRSAYKQGLTAAASASQPISQPMSQPVSVPISMPVPQTASGGSPDAEESGRRPGRSPEQIKYMHDLAGKYVDLYHNGTSQPLTREQRAAMIQDIAAFYSVPSRQGRLEKLVGTI